MNQNRSTNRRRTGGFSMIELLVAVLVMGIGVLGITGLQMISLQNNRAALQRADAVQLAYDMLDRVRANRGVPAAGAPAGNAYDGVALGDAPPAFVDCQAANCTTNQMVSFDIALWKCSLGGHDAEQACIDARTAGALFAPGVQPGLPDGDGSIAVNNANGVIRVTVQWQPPGAANPVNVFVESQG